MLKRIYIHNYKCLNAFEMELDDFSVFCGYNGSGKSAVFDAVELVRDLALGDIRLRKTNNLDFCHWVDYDIQEFEIEIEKNNMRFIYKLHLQQVAEHEAPKIIKEAAYCDDCELFSRDFDKVCLNDGKTFSLDMGFTVLSSIHLSRSQEKLKTLQDMMIDIIILRPNTQMFERISPEESNKVDRYMSNIISWYRYYAQDQDWTDILRESLQGVWPEDFKSLKLLGFSSASHKELELNFEGISLKFSALSDGEKMLVALYIIHAVLATSKDSMCIMIDEPDNYLNIQEIQPWLLSMEEVIGKTKQLIMITHNVEILEFLRSRNCFFYRDNHKSPTRVQKPLKIQEGLTIREAFTRGWIDV